MAFVVVETERYSVDAEGVIRDPSHYQSVRDTDEFVATKMVLSEKRGRNIARPVFAGLYSRHASVLGVILKGQGVSRGEAGKEKTGGEKPHG